MVDTTTATTTTTTASTTTTAPIENRDLPRRNVGGFCYIFHSCRLHVDLVT
jgi:hypothetical protein